VAVWLWDVPKGFPKQIQRAQALDAARESYVTTLQNALRSTTRAVDASGLGHNELWSYRIAGDRLLPIRYGSSSDVQLWNTTDLAVEFVLSQLPH